MSSVTDIKAGAAYVELYSENNKLLRGLKAAEGHLRAFGDKVVHEHLCHPPLSLLTRNYPTVCANGLRRVDEATHPAGTSCET